MIRGWHADEPCTCGHIAHEHAASGACQVVEGSWRMALGLPTVACPCSMFEPMEAP